MCALLLRRMINGSVQKPNTDNSKNDLRLVFERSFSSSCSSPDVFTQPAISQETPPRKAPSTPKPTLFELIAKDVRQAPAKKLYSCPQLEIKKTEKKKEVQQGYLYNSAAFTTLQYIDLPLEIQQYITFEFNGGDDQPDAWKDFKTKVKDSKYSIVVCANIVFAFEEGKVKAKAITGTAQRKLESVMTSYPQIEIKAALDFIEKLAMNDTLKIVSSTMFHYSEIKPIKIKRTEFESVTGKKYRFILTGNIFPFIALEAKKRCELAGKVSTSTSIVY